MGKHKHHSHHHKEEDISMKDMCKILTSDPSEKNVYHYTIEEAYQIGKLLGIDFEKSGYSVDEFRVGLETELEHGAVNPITNVTNNDPILTGKIALAHLNEFPDYYIRLKKMESEAMKYWSKKQ